MKKYDVELILIDEPLQGVKNKGLTAKNIENLAAEIYPEINNSKVLFEGIPRSLYKKFLIEEKSQWDHVAKSIPERLNIHTIKELRKFLRRTYKTVMEYDKIKAENNGKRDVFFTHVGLIRAAIYGWTK